MIKGLLFLYYIGAYTLGILTLLRVRSIRALIKPKIFTVFFAATSLIFATLTLGILQNYISAPNNSIASSIFFYISLLLAIMISYSMIRFYFLVFWEPKSKLIKTLSLMICATMLAVLGLGIFFIEKQSLQNIILTYKNFIFIGCFILAFLSYHHKKSEPFNQFLFFLSLCMIPLIPFFILTEIPAFHRLAPEFLLSIRLIGPWTVPAAGILWSCIFLFCFKRFQVHNQIRQQLSQEFIKETGLTPREVDVAKLILEGKSYKSICTQLSISMPTVKTHLSNVYKKTSTGNRLELAAIAGTFPHTKE